jgi:thiamine biosynthesis lipoprotein
VKTEPAACRRRLGVFMDTVVSVVLVDASPDADRIIDRAFAWFSSVESVCSRFDPTSEAMRLSATVGRRVRVSALLFEAVRFAVAVARLSDGAFDPSIGGLMQARGFDRNYRTGLRIAVPLPASPSATYRDIEVDSADRSITLHRPLVLDLGGVAKGLAIDLAAMELTAATNYAIDAGGDVYVSGRNANREPWRVGIRHPRQMAAIWCVLQLSHGAVCTSGDYARPGTGGEHHLVDPRMRQSPQELASTSVVAPTAMLADALSTAAFVLGAKRGLRLLESQGVDGITLTRKLRPVATDGFARLVAAPAA